jgi:hypothetical protein
MIKDIKLSNKKEDMTFNKQIITTILMKMKYKISINLGKTQINSLNFWITILDI